jgi:hypothetical protein
MEHRGQHSGEQTSHKEDSVEAAEKIAQAKGRSSKQEPGDDGRDDGPKGEGLGNFHYGFRVDAGSDALMKGLFYPFCFFRFDVVSATP